MHRDSNRTARVASFLQTELAKNIANTFPSFGKELFAISYIQVSPDLSYADVYCSCKENIDIRPMLAELDQAKRQIRHKLLQGSPLKKFPQLRFRADKVSNSSRRIDELLKQVRDQLSKSKA